MRRYETVFVANPALSQEERQPLFDKLTNLISDEQGLLVKLDEWGLKSLAYEIKKHPHGYYVLIDFCGDGSLVNELERNMSLDDRLLKYMTVCIAKEVDVEAVKAEIEAAKEEEPKPGLVEEAAQSGAEEESPPIETSKTAPEETEVSEDTSELSDEEEPANGEASGEV